MYAGTAKTARVTPPSSDSAGIVVTVSRDVERRLLSWSDSLYRWTIPSGRLVEPVATFCSDLGTNEAVTGPKIYELSSVNIR